MATTTNFGWETPDDTDLVKDGAAAIRTALGGVDTSFVDLKGGTTGQVLSKASNTDLDYTWTTVSTGTTEVNPNLVINGNFTINQRAYTSGTNLASGSYGFDRWKSNYTNTALTFTTAPQGQSVTISTDGVIRQVIERSNVASGSYTLSWTGTATGRIYNSGGTPPSYAASPVSFTADGLADVIIEFTAVATTKTLSKVKLEIGANATSFVYAGGTYEGELAACQRYYIRYTAPEAYSHFAQGWAINTDNAIVYFNLPVEMRTVPTAIDYASVNIGDSVNPQITPSTITFTADNNNTKAIGCTGTKSAGGMTQYRNYQFLAAGTTAAYIGFSAEL